MDQKLTNEIASVQRDPFTPQFANRLMPNDDTLAQRGGSKGLKIYEEIERDNHAYGVLHKRKMAVAARPWEVQPFDGSALAKAAAELVQRQLKGLNFDKLTYDLLDAILKGYAVGEIVWMQGDHDEIVAKTFIARAQRRFVFGLDRLPRLLTADNMLDGEDLPDRKFIVYSFGAQDANPYGLGLGTRLFWPAFFKRKGITFWMTFADKFGSPTAVGKYPSGATTTDELDKLKSALAALANDVGVTIPDTMLIEFIEAQRSGSVDTYDKLVAYMDKQMSIAVLGEELTTSAKATGLGSSAAQVQDDVRLELARADSDLLSMVLNETLVRWIVELNMPLAPVPTVFRRIEGAVDLNQLAERDKLIYDMGFEPTEEYINETYGGDWKKRAAPPPLLPFGRQAPPGNDHPSFADTVAIAPDQAAIDSLLAGLPKDALQAQARAMLQPVIDALLNADSYEEALGKLADLYPQLDGAALETLLGRALFVAETWGRLSVARNG